MDGLGDEVSHLADGDGAVIGLDEQTVEWGGGEGVDIGAGTEGQVAAVVKQELCHALIGAHAVDGERHMGESCLPPDIEDALGCPDTVHNDRFAQGMCELQVAQKCCGLGVEVTATQGVHACLADGKHLGMPGTSLEHYPVVLGEGVDAMPRMEAHRVVAPWLGVELPWIYRDECIPGIGAMGMEVEDGHFSFWFLVPSPCFLVLGF